MTKTSIKHISKDGRGHITSKVTKPKDWAFRTQSEGRAKHVHSPRAKPVKLEHSMQRGCHLKLGLLAYKAGIKDCEWRVSCESPFRAQFDASDVLYAYHGMENDSTYEIKFSREHRIFIFCDLTDILTGAREEAIAPALTKDEIEIAKRHVSKTEKPVIINLKSVQKKLRKKKKLPHPCG